MSFNCSKKKLLILFLKMKNKLIFVQNLKNFNFKNLHKIQFFKFYFKMSHFVFEMFRILLLHFLCFTKKLLYFCPFLLIILFFCLKKKTKAPKSAPKNKHGKKSQVCNNKSGLLSDDPDLRSNV